MKSHASVLGSTLLVALFAVVSSSPFTAAASSSASDAGQSPAPDRRSPSTAPAAFSAAADLAASTEGSGTSCEAEQKLARLDARVPVPLLPHMANHQKQNMRDHLLAVQEIVAATAKGDFGAVEVAVERIGFSEEMGQMCNHMGAGAPGFTEQALQFHHTADTIAAAARLRDSAAVLQALGRTLATCTACHATFRQSVVDQATWSSRPTKMAPMPPMPPEAPAGQ